MLKKFELNDDEKKLISRITVLQMAVHRHLCENVQDYKKLNYSYRHIEDLLSKEQQDITCEIACRNLLDSYSKYSCKDEYLIERIKLLITDVSNSSLVNEKIFFSSYDEKACKISQYHLLVFFDLAKTVSISCASEKLDIPTSTIKNACQNRRLKNIEKEGKFWRVHIGECARLWSKDTETYSVPMPYMD